MSLSKKAPVLIISLLLAVLLLVGCTSQNQNTQSTPNNQSTLSPSAAPSAAAGDGVVFEGLPGGQVTMTVDQIKAMKSVEKSVTSLDSQGEINKCKAKGVILNDFLKSYGKKQTDFSIIRVTATDGYVVEIPKDVIDAEDIILAYELDGKPLEKDNAPLRIIIDNVRSLYWARMVGKVEFLTQAQEATVKRIVILESTYVDLQKEDYEYYNDGKTSKDTAVKMSELLGKYAKGESADTYYIKASDGLEKTQQKDIIEKFYLKIDGDGAPMLTSKDIPVGMHVKDLFTLRCGSTVFYSVEKTLQQDKTAALSKIASDAGLTADTFILAATDGYSKEITKDELKNWHIKLSSTESGPIVAYQTGAEDKGIKNFLSITAK
ncbi:MAG: molybdopterin-dependent oxidoreductase [Bacillota bacterium]